MKINSTGEAHKGPLRRYLKHRLINGYCDDTYILFSTYIAIRGICSVPLNEEKNRERWNKIYPHTIKCIELNMYIL